MATIEIRLRTFFTCDEAQISPSTTVALSSEAIGDIPWASTVADLAAQTARQLEGGPFTNLREMTEDEVTEFLAAEANE